MDEEPVKKRVTLVQAVVACAITLLTAVAGGVAWASGFQTKTSAAAVTARVEKVESAQAAGSVEMQGARTDIARIDATTQRLDDKLDKVLMRLGSRR